MPRSTLAFLAAALLFLAPTASASHPRGSSGGSHHSSRSYSGHSRAYSGHSSGTHSRSYTRSPSHHYSTHHYSAPSQHTRRYATGVLRDKHGRIKRSEAAKNRFELQTGYPHERPGYVVDHLIPLSEGGRDDPSNMQWQTKEEANAKDRTERKH